ncbi:MAG: YhcH/YjgK/YiaL family protein [Clostridia bacterium]|nr:YhcH/YjgK/YiaL family protein [Clostridia bacterium]
MIFDKLENLKNYANLNNGFKEVVDFIETHDLLSLPQGKEAVSDNVYYMRQQYVGKPEVDDLYESHVNYVDVQIVLDGAERHYYSKAQPIVSELNQKDCYFTSAKKDCSIELTKNTFVIFFAGELHKPGLKVNEEKVEKIVFKVKA